MIFVVTVAASYRLLVIAAHTVIEIQLLVLHELVFMPKVIYYPGKFQLKFF